MSIDRIEVGWWSGRTKTEERRVAIGKLMAEEMLDRRGICSRRWLETIPITLLWVILPLLARWIASRILTDACIDKEL